MDSEPALNRIRSLRVSCCNPKFYLEILYHITQLPISSPSLPPQADGFPKETEMANYQTRLIIRDVTGKYTWDAAVLYGPEQDKKATGIYIYPVAM